MKKGRDLLIFWFILTIVIGNLYGQTQTKVESGAVIIDGRYIEPPYLIEMEEIDKDYIGILINGVVAEKRFKRKAYNEIIREDRIRSEIYAEYFELGEKLGWEKAREKIKENIMEKGEIKEFKVKIKFKTPQTLEIILASGENFNIKLSSNPTENEKQYMFNCLLRKKYEDWYKAISGDKEKAYNSLVEILKKQKSKGFIEEYSIKDDIWRIKYTNSLITFSLSPMIFCKKGRTIPDEECDRFDKENIQRRIKSLERVLSSGHLEVFSKGGHVYGGPDGETTISELKKIMADKKLDENERKKMIKKVYPPANFEERYLGEILSNFGK